jgi:hypothetical protein
VKKADMVLSASIGPPFGALFAPVIRDHNSEHVVDQVHFYLSVDLCRRRQGWRRIHLDEPRLKVRVEQYVEPVQLEAVFVINHNALHRFETDPNDVVNFVPTLLGSKLALGLFQVKPHVRDRPLAAVLIIVVRSLLCDRDVG